MLKRFSLFYVLVFNFSFIISAQDSSHLRISLLTCQPGGDLYSTFGHSALRIIDSVSHNDIVFNYGTFDFSEPGFYMKFIRGKLLYYLSTEDFEDFKKFYKEENRGITEQVLQLSFNEKKNITRLLQQNLNSENRFYKYDFLFDNCTTRLRDLIEKTAESTIAYESVLQKKTTFRQLIYEYLDYGDKQWSKLGIDLLLGSKTDAVMTTREVMFLPEYLMKTLDHSRIGGIPIVASSQSLYNTLPTDNLKNFLTHPEVIFTIFALALFALSFSQNATAKKIIQNFDGVLFFIAGALGVLILFMWFGTEHKMCSNNYNLLWALPTHLIAAIFINKKNNVVKNYFRFITVINSLLIIAWFFLPQHMNISLLPIVMLLTYRSVIIGYKQQGTNFTA